MDTTHQIINFSTNSYKLQYPKSWSLDSSRALGSDLFVFSPLEDETDKFRENVNVMIQNLKGQNIDLEKYKEITEKQIANLATDGEIIESSIKKSATGDFFRITYVMTQGKFRIKITSICILREGQAYLVTFSSELAKYDSYKETSENILSSFSLKE
jgi:hypothetical protein